MSDPRLDRMASTADNQTSAPEPDQAPPKAQKPALIGIDFAQKSVVSTVGFAPLTDKELKIVTAQALTAFSRMLDGVLNVVGASVKSRKRGRPRKKSASIPSTTGKRRGRPPKVKVANVPSAPPSPAPPRSDHN